MDKSTFRFDKTPSYITSVSRWNSQWLAASSSSPSQSWSRKDCLLVFSAAVSWSHSQKKEFKLKTLLPHRHSGNVLNNRPSPACNYLNWYWWSVWFHMTKTLNDLSEDLSMVWFEINECYASTSCWGEGERVSQTDAFDLRMCHIQTQTVLQWHHFGQMICFCMAPSGATNSFIQLLCIASAPQDL